MRFVRPLLRYWSGASKSREVVYAAGLLAFHLFLLLTLPQLVGALSLQSTLIGELALGGALLLLAQGAMRRYARRAWLQGYTTGHWDGLGDATDGAP